MKLNTELIQELSKDEAINIDGGGAIDWFARKIHVWQNVWKLNKAFLDNMTGKNVEEFVESTSRIPS